MENESLYWVVFSTDITKLTGRGLEYLLDKDGNPIAKFEDGRLVGAIPSGNSEVTKAA